MTLSCHGRWRVALTLSALLVLISWRHVYMISCVAYTYMYWTSPSLNWAVPGVVDSTDDFPVPAIIHQTWKSKDIPEKWKAAQQSCVELHPDYEYRLWTDDDGLELIKREYSWFLPTFLSYPYAIQRVDAVRYFILHKFGGIYIDLDMGCKKRIDFIRQANYTAPLTYPIGLSNDLMASRPGSMFLAEIIKQLPRWNHWLFIKYIQVMFSTGPMFLTVQYALSKWELKNEVFAIPPPIYGKYDFTGDAVFYHLHGSSWHADDAAFIFWLDKYRSVLIAVGIVAVIGLGVSWELRRRRRSTEGLQRDNAEAEKSY